jgi:hypothetical protein
MLLHRLGAIFILTSTLFYGTYAYFKLQRVVNDVHAPLGLTITALTIFLFLSGALVRKILQADLKNSKKAKYFHKVRIIPYILILDFWLVTYNLRSNNHLFWDLQLFKFDE